MAGRSRDDIDYSDAAATFGGPADGCARGAGRRAGRAGLAPGGDGGAGARLGGGPRRATGQPAASGVISGQQPFREGLQVREPQEAWWGVTPTYGRLEVRARMELSPRSMASVWMVGIEDEPHRCGEICIFEIFGDALDGGAQRRRRGGRPPVPRRS